MRVPAGPCGNRPVRRRPASRCTYKIVSRPAGYPNSTFREGLSKGRIRQMNDWSRLAVGPTGRKNSRPGTKLHAYRYASIQTRGRRLIRKREVTTEPSGGGEGQLRLSLTNTYHEWPVKRATRTLLGRVRQHPLLSEDSSRETPLTEAQPTSGHAPARNI